VWRSSAEPTAGLVGVWGVLARSPPEFSVFEREEALEFTGIDKRRYSSYAITIQLCFALFQALRAHNLMNECMKKKLSTQTSKEEGNRPVLSKPPRRTYNSFSLLVHVLKTMISFPSLFLEEDLPARGHEIYRLE